MTRRVLRGDQTPTARMDLGKGDWVEYKTRLSLVDRDFINAAMTERYVQRTLVNQAKAQKNGQSTPEIDLSRTNTVTLLRTLVDWGGPGFCVVDHDADGSPHDMDTQKQCGYIPITEENVASLDEEDAQLILNEIGKRNPAPDEPVPLES